MIRNINEYAVSENEALIQFLNEYELEKLKKADDNPFVRISLPDKSIPFVVLPDGGVVADITANNPKTILKDIQINIPAGRQPGAGFIDIYHGNKTLLFRHIESAIFGKKWRVDDIASALQIELNLYYPGYLVRSH
jgi:hypothetical protein